MATLAPSRVVLEGALRSYGQLFFCRRLAFCALLLGVSFLEPWTGALGLAAVLGAQALGLLLGFDRSALREGSYGFGALLLGLSSGAAYAAQPALAALLPAAVTMGLLLGVWGYAGALRYGLPLLSLAYLPAAWAFSLAAQRLDLTASLHHALPWDASLAAALPSYLRCYLQAMGGLLFQSSPSAGILVSAGLLLHSRIAWQLSWLGLGLAWACMRLAGLDPCAFTSPAAGFNLGLSAIAIGGVLAVPSRRSFLWALILVPVTLLLSLALERALDTWSLALYGLPFGLVACGYVAVLRARSTPGGPVLAALPHESPERSLYRQAQQDATRVGLELPLRLPFLGAWTLTQGDHGAHTHQGDWAYALDFELLDEQGRGWKDSGQLLSDHESWGKPVLAPAAAYVEALVDGVEDNAPGRINTAQNWGNSVVLRLAPGLWAQLSHLQKGSLKVKVGDWVYAGQILALCGNSGRSPVPHIHFQIQLSPQIGAPSIAYPLRRYACLAANGQSALREQSRPAQGERVENLRPDPAFLEALRFGYGQRFRVQAAGGRAELWEAGVDLFNRAYLACQASGARAYYSAEPDCFRILDYEGPSGTALASFSRTFQQLPLEARRGLRCAYQSRVDAPGRPFWLLLQDLCGLGGLFLRAEVRQQAEPRGNGLVPAGWRVRAVRQVRAFSRRLSLSRVRAELDPDGALRWEEAEAGQRQRYQLREERYA